MTAWQAGPEQQPAKRVRLSPSKGTQHDTSAAHHAGYRLTLFMLLHKSCTCPCHKQDISCAKPCSYCADDSETPDLPSTSRLEELKSPNSATRESTRLRHKAASSLKAKQDAQKPHLDTGQSGLLLEQHVFVHKFKPKSMWLCRCAVQKPFGMSSSLP